MDFKTIINVLMLADFLMLIFIAAIALLNVGVNYANY